MSPLPFQSRYSSIPTASAPLPTLLRGVVLGVTMTITAAACSNHDARPMRVTGAAGELYLDSLPLLTVGGPNAAEEFGDVVGVGRLSDGGFMVGDGTDGRLRLYDSTGKSMRSVGAHGSGPGEFAQLRWAGVLSGDTLIAFDWSGWRFSLFTRDGAFVRSFRLVLLR